MMLDLLFNINRARTNKTKTKTICIFHALFVFLLIFYLSSVVVVVVAAADETVCTYPITCK